MKYCRKCKKPLKTIDEAIKHVINCLNGEKPYFITEKELEKK